MKTIDFKSLSENLTSPLNIVFISAEWCEPCVAIQKPLFALVEKHPEVNCLYINIKDRGESISGTIFEGKIRGFPSVTIVDNKNELLYISTNSLLVAETIINRVKESFNEKGTTEQV